MGSQEGDTSGAGTTPPILGDEREAPRCQEGFGDTSPRKWSAAHRDHAKFVGGCIESGPLRREKLKLTHLMPANIQRGLWRRYADEATLNSDQLLSTAVQDHGDHVQEGDDPASDVSTHVRRVATMEPGGGSTLRRVGVASALEKHASTHPPQRSSLPSR